MGPLQAHPEELPHPRRQIEVGHPAGHVEQLQAEERHDVADDDPDQDDLGRDAQGCARGDLGGQETKSWPTEPAALAAQLSWSSSAFASLRSCVSKPSLNQP